MSERVTLTKLATSDADELVEMLLHPSLYVVIGDAPADRDEAHARAMRWATGSPDTGSQWINAVARLRTSVELVELCQATLTMDEHGRANDCTLGWLVHPRHHRRDYGTEMTRKFVDYTNAQYHPRQFTAHIAPGHTGSEKVAAAAGLVATGSHNHIGELIWHRR